jgi:glycosyltransferase involved in cell wall biosynthesis
MRPPKYSIIVPVYNRPQEVEELLESLTHQVFKDFEVIVVEDGSTQPSSDVVRRYTDRLPLRYFGKPNTGPGPSRNFGFEQALGAYLVAFDSDCLIPSSYFDAVERAMAGKPLDAWGGPDRGDDRFTRRQRAMAYTMSAFLTTGGIRGGRSKGFQLRSYNMGISRDVFARTGGFRFDRLAEDVELSLRIEKAGFRVTLIPEAYVIHKRRTNFKQFFRQVYGFGCGRARVGKAHPGTTKLTHWFPTFFSLGLLTTAGLAAFWPSVGAIAAMGYALYFGLIAMGALLTTSSGAVALLSIPSALVQLTGYGIGFLSERIRLMA